MNAVSVRNTFIESHKELNNHASLIVHEAIAGEHATQGGYFDIEVGSLLLRVCVWASNTVEIQSMDNDSGEMKEIQTLENTNESESANAIKCHVEKNT